MQGYFYHTLSLLSDLNIIGTIACLEFLAKTGIFIVFYLLRAISRGEWKRLLNVYNTEYLLNVYGRKYLLNVYDAEWFSNKYWLSILCNICWIFRVKKMLYIFMIQVFCYTFKKEKIMNSLCMKYLSNYSCTEYVFLNVYLFLNAPFDCGKKYFFDWCFCKNLV